MINKIIDYFDERDGFSNFIYGIIFSSICYFCININKLCLIPSIFLFLLIIHFGLKEHSFG